MAHIQFNIAKGEIKTHFVGITGTNALIVVPCVGVATDDALADADDLAAALAVGTLDEHATMGRKTINAGVTPVTDDTNNWYTVTIGSITWTAPAANATPTTRLLICHDSNTGTGTDSNIVPLLAYDFVVTTDGNDVVVSPHANGLIRIT